jgi:CheY-like chemotaxis protein
MSDTRPPLAAPPANQAAREALRVVVVDADDRTRQSIVGILGIRDRFRVVGSAGNVEAAVDVVRDRCPDVVIMDPRLPELTGGIALIRAIRALDPASRILALGWSPELELDARSAGVDGFVRKTFKPADLAEAIGRCMDAVRAPTGDDVDPDAPAPLAAAAPSPVPAPPGSGLLLQG